MFFLSNSNPASPNRHRSPSSSIGGAEFIEKCICELCECGDHCCPHVGTLGVEELASAADEDRKFGAQSEYGRSFVRKEALPAGSSFRAQSLAPASRIGLPAMVLESTHQHDFLAWICEMPIIRGPPEADAEAEQRLKPMEPFTAKTTHQLDFDIKPIPEENLLPPKGQQSSLADHSSPSFYPSPKAPFYGKTVHQMDFGPKPLEPAKSFRPSNNRPVTKEMRPQMEAETTHRHDFRHFKCAEPAKPFRPLSGSRYLDEDAMERKQTFEDLTEHQANFGPKSVQPSASFHPKSRESTRPISQPMGAKNEYQEGFHPMPNVDKSVKIRRPESRNAQIADGPFDAKTTHQIDFAPKPSIPERICPAERVLTHRDHSYQFSGIRSGHRYYRRFHASRPEPMQSMRLAPVQG